MQNLTFNEYKEILSQDKVLIIDFLASWCGPCKMFAPVFEKVAEELGDKFAFAKVDVDNQQQIAIENKIYTIPTLVITKNGVEIARKSGYMNEAELKSFILNNVQ